METLFGIIVGNSWVMCFFFSFFLMHELSYQVHYYYSWPGFTKIHFYLSLFSSKITLTKVNMYVEKI